MINNRQAYSTKDVSSHLSKLLLSSTLLLVLLILIAFKVSVIQRADIWGLQQIHELLNAQLTPIMIAITRMGSPELSTGLMLIIGVGYLIRRRVWQGIQVGILSIGGNALAFVVKELVRRPRPTHQIFPDTGFSTPSGHVFCTMLLVLVIYQLVRQLKFKYRILVAIGLYCWVLLVMFSRVYLHVHYPSDVLSALFLAFSWWQLVMITYQWAEVKGLWQIKK